MNELTSLIEKNKILILMWLSSLVVIYMVGLDHGFIDHATLCKNDIISLEQCQLDLVEHQKICNEELVKCKANCIIKDCKALCIKEAQQAVDNYKGLMKAIECGK